MAWMTLFFGVAIGILLAIPAAWGWSRRTERRVRQLEARARTAERLAELGTMTGGLAHEIKNPLSTVGLNVQLIQEDLADLADVLPAPPEPEDGQTLPQRHGDPPRERLARIQKRTDGLHRETARLRDILEDFLRFAGRVELDRQPTDLNALCDELIDFFQPQADEARVKLRCDLHADPAIVSADPALLKQALLNLLINACQAMTLAREKDEPSGGNSELILRTANTKSAGQDQIAIHVTDTGPGIAPDVLEKIFQPYFSSKRGGSGLGLPTTRRLVEEHDGTLTVHSDQARGSDFVITLPMG
ncbi:sensor histidine kinase [Algisphaera agarilytica]|uniref:histidine kinase n=1 Tax=Algisphaera agarilytica TaxID=1385975 RepID=A0A7X0H3W8_9BACT|nr:ATP-binding protein [Algisphaera agarilytica]MBB6428780.1 signal transduction histidine kinase [Algisphaera agarilytica]